MKFLRMAVVLGLVYGGLSACTKNSDGTLNNPLKPFGFRDIGAQIESITPTAAQVRIVDMEGNGIGSADVMIGNGPNDPFTGNQITTDASGYATPPAAWKGALPMTVEAVGFTRATFLNVAPGQIQLEMHKEDSPDSYKVSGQTTGFGKLKTDGYVDFGLVLMGVHKRQILQFDMSSMLSPEVDTISVLGKQVEIPSNLTLPQQQESYIFPITLNKPNYRHYVRGTGIYNFMAIHGNFPLGTVVDEIRDGKTMFEVIHYFSFLSGGMTQSYVGSSGLTQDLEISTQSFSNVVSRTAPNYGSGLTMVAAALTESGDYLYPTDVKVAAPNQTVQLNSPAGTTATLSMLKKESNRMAQTALPQALDMSPFSLRMFSTETKATAADDFSQLSFVYQSSADSATPEFLDLISAPSVNGQTLNLTAPKTISGIQTVATLLIYSEIEQTGGGSVKLEKRTRLWEVLASGWVSTITLPTVALTPDPNKNYKWEVLYLGRKGTSSPSNLLDGITHVTRNAVDL